MKDYTGRIFGDFTVIETYYKIISSESKNTKRLYCRCIGIDGNEYDIRADALTSGSTKHVKNAGHKQEFKDITGMRSGNVTALYPVNTDTCNHSYIWHCICDCGTEFDTFGSNIRRGKTKTCGCGRKHGWKEDRIAAILSELGIEFIREKIFDDCYGVSIVNNCRFDFYLPKLNTVIEYDGIHHYHPVKFYGGEEHFKIIKQNDEIKNSYCKEHNINLIRIPYTMSAIDIKNYIKTYVSPVTTTVA